MPIFEPVASDKAYTELIAARSILLLQSPFKRTVPVIGAYIRSSADSVFIYSAAATVFVFDSSMLKKL